MTEAGAWYARQNGPNRLGTVDSALPTQMHAEEPQGTPPMNKRIRFQSTLVASIGMLALLAGPAMAQENVSSASGKQTALTAAQSQAEDAWTYSLALQTANWGAPLVTMYDMRYLDAVGPARKASPSAIWRMENGGGRTTDDQPVSGGRARGGHDGRRQCWAGAAASTSG